MRVSSEVRIPSPCPMGEGEVWGVRVSVSVSSEVRMPPTVPATTDRMGWTRVIVSVEVSLGVKCECKA